ncbi:S-adenosyl-L-methionine-dependent methyltransferase [Annulohypoxylon maeteangense]|uniref:S-adenosyl-L-methionine-dependent methyltransferase n=1 Tax=Annulohypoxylon maeteangense TaxID=1927788 RepID=UPI0020089590|nr:S-adenosyl-L-methionine-dependent methyltransferase [Annulohypoxylon maeteangense]KAI0879976.1 S-adenosyl-L-methionine-dependent methyltransferase [Annulohypoxylon maeteangense]
MLNLKKKYFQKKKTLKKKLGNKILKPMRLYTTVVSRLVLRGNRSIHPLTSSYPSSLIKPLICSRPFHFQQQQNAKKRKPEFPVFDDFNNEEWPQFTKTGAQQPISLDKFNEWLEMADQPKEKSGQKNGGGKRSHPQQKMKKEKKYQKKPRKRERDMTTGSNEEVLAFDIQSLKESLVQDDDGKNETDEAALEILPEEGSEIDVDVVELASTGEGLALQKGSKRIYVVPFGIPGDTLKVKAYRHLQSEGYTVADFISVVTPSPSRDDSRVQCKYFSTCSGCQFQMLDYAEQLRLKKRIVEKAYRNFSQLPPELIPTIQDTMGSPLQYGYRTKLTPHFDAPQGWRKTKQPFKQCPPIGFMPKGKRHTLDIEDCPIATDAVRLGMRNERARMAVEYGKYTRGATILLRESTRRVPKKRESSPSSSPKEASTTEPPRSRPPSIPPPDAPSVRVETDTYTDIKTCVTDNNGTSTEYIGSYVFHNPAGSFFQNNNSILPDFTSYIRSHILPPDTDTTTDITNLSLATPAIKNLIDAYSGSGLFTITLSSLLTGSSVGVDVSDASIAYASHNARANAIPLERARFIAADAKQLFTPTIHKRYPPDETVVVLDPPRKGCDTDFLSQLLRFGPKRVIYVSCNVHTQARDVGMLVRGEVDMPGGEGVELEMGNGGGNGKKTKYSIESLRGFDFFPQTGHVEGVCVLNRVDEE